MIREEGQLNPVWNPGVLVALEGNDCTERFRVDTPNLYPGTSVAVGDLDGDFRPEIVAEKHNGGFRGEDVSGVAAFDGDGALLWETALVHCGLVMGPQIANLDGQGTPEVLCAGGNGPEGMAVFDALGTELWRKAPLEIERGRNTWSYDAAIADVDLDGELEVVEGNRILDGASGELEAEFEELAAGGVAIADFDPRSPEPEIAVVGYMTDIRLQTIDGAVIFGPFDYFSEAPPTAADYDGDGQVEFAVLVRPNINQMEGGPSFIVFDPDCDPIWARDGGECNTGRDDGILWEKSVQTDAAANTTGTVFDLDGDGFAEVIFNDACYLHLYDGRTGETRLSVPSSDGGFWHYPVVADVDGDAHAEIVVAANEHSALNAGPTSCAPNPYSGATFDRVRVGVRVFRDPQDRWMPARPIWNQHAYSVTNVERRRHRAGEPRAQLGGSRPQRLPPELARRGDARHARHRPVRARGGGYGLLSRAPHAPRDRVQPRHDPGAPAGRRRLLHRRAARGRRAPGVQHDARRGARPRRVAVGLVRLAGARTPRSRDLGARQRRDLGRRV